ncbi:ABC transporter ATP-binding protein [Secundilactobacillus kimchicus]|uniref:ABC transporter ATP-binding protein n=1 Tax=Secundilactobacillus kimchicus TaxID=528209 RepID=UPI000AEEB5CE|nr:ABC transporter ATP-binding protein [Secundilactobacillus kimchicus]
MAFVKLSDLTIQYQSYDSKVAWPPTIDHLSATFESGTLTLLTGPSGSGKSTLLKTIAGLYPKFGEASVSGSVTIETSSTQPRVAMMFQDPNQQFAMDTVERELRFALENLQVEADKIDDQVQAALDYVGISNLRHRQLNNLSGGEKQKVALAIIVAMDSEVILLDEPFASIDPAARQTLLIKLRQLNQEAHKTVIIADHDLLNYELC